MNNKETKECPYCCEEILSKAIKCKHCGSDLRKFRNGAIVNKDKKIDETIGNLMIIIPIAYIFLILTWIWNLKISQQPKLILDVIANFVLIATATLAAIETGWLGIGSESTAHTKAEKRWGPITWFIFILLFWIIGYPSYLYHRRKYGLKNRLKAGITITIIFSLETLLAYYHLQ